MRRVCRSLENDAIHLGRSPRSHSREAFDFWFTEGRRWGVIAREAGRVKAGFMCDDEAELRHPPDQALLRSETRASAEVGLLRRAGSHSSIGRHFWCTIKAVVGIVLAEREDGRSSMRSRSGTSTSIYCVETSGREAIKIHSSVLRRAEHHEVSFTSFWCTVNVEVVYWS